MGRLILPVGGEVYVDAQIPIYTADVHPTYAPVLRPLWDAGVAGTIHVVSSELTLMETLVGPLRSGNTLMQKQREGLWQRVNSRLLPITQDVLRKRQGFAPSFPR